LGVKKKIDKKQQQQQQQSLACGSTWAQDSVLLTFMPQTIVPESRWQGDACLLTTVLWSMQVSARKVRQITPKAAEGAAQAQNPRAPYFTQQAKKGDPGHLGELSSSVEPTVCKEQSVKSIAVRSSSLRKAGGLEEVEGKDRLRRD
jgi:hypothetical protein